MFFTSRLPFYAVVFIHLTTILFFPDSKRNILPLHLVELANDSVAQTFPRGEETKRIREEKKLTQGMDTFMRLMVQVLEEVDFDLLHLGSDFLKPVPTKEQGRQFLPSLLIEKETHRGKKIPEKDTDNAHCISGTSST